MNRPGLIGLLGFLFVYGYRAFFQLKNEAANRSITLWFSPILKIHTTAFCSVTKMAAMATATTYHGGAFGRRYSSQHHPHVLSRQYYDRKLNWKPMRMGVEVAKICRLTARANAKVKSERNAEPYALSEAGGRYYLEELDVVAFLDPPKELIPFDPSSYNPASYLWLVLLNACFRVLILVIQR